MKQITKTVIFSQLCDCDELNYILPMNVGNDITIGDQSDTIKMIEWDFDNGVMYVTTNGY